MLFNDPGCPWGYSAWPALTTLRWRYGDGLRWRLVLIGLAETPERYVRSGYTPGRQAAGYARFRDRFGMPVLPAPRERVMATGLACRAVVATRLRDPDREWAVLRALQFGFFCSDVLLDTEDGLRAALATVPGLDVDAVLAPGDDVEAAYQADREETRQAEGTPSDAQGKTAQTDGPVRFTAPTLVLTHGPDRLEAGGWQSLEAYDVLVANLDPGLPRRGPAEDAGAALAAFPDGLTTQEVAELRRPSPLEPVDRAGVEAELLELAAAGRARRLALGSDALWTAA